MKALFGFLITIMLFQSCWVGCSGCSNSTAVLESMTDHFNYESITNARGTVLAKFGDSTFSYPHAKIIYSETDVATLLIRTQDGKYVYIQGPAIVLFDTLEVDKYDWSK